MDRERICLLDIAPVDEGLVQRRVIEVTIDGERAWREFDVVKIFTNEREAIEFAEANQIDDVQV